MEKQIKELLEESVSKLGIVIDSVEYVKEGSNYFLRIVIDRDEVIDIDTCVEVTNIINPILDSSDIIKDSYILDVTTKEKGEHNE
ncbi:MAG: hypothetical protein IJO57_00200 [Bacilli bacterium]|nr:hypothetical protein [Bacilli bacterium]